MLIDAAPRHLDSLRGLLNSVPFVPDLSEITDRLQNYLSRLAYRTPSLVTDLSWVLGEAVAVVFLAVYMAASPGPLISGALRLVPEERRGGVEEFVEVLEVRLRGWIVGTLLMALFIGVGAGLGLWILGVPLPLTFGIVAGVLNFVPFLGSTVGAPLPVLVALTISPVKALLVVGLFIILNQIEAHILQPQIMGRQIHAHPAMMLVSFLVLGVLLNAMVGALLAVPTAVFAGVSMDRLTSKKPSPGDEETEEGSAPDI